jgi:hypothetical protein
MSDTHIWNTTTTQRRVPYTEEQTVNYILRGSRDSEDKRRRILVQKFDLAKSANMYLMELENLRKANAELKAIADLVERCKKLGVDPEELLKREVEFPSLASSAIAIVK